MLRDLLVLATSLGAGAADATPWKFGPVYRGEFSGEGAEYLCNKALLLEKAYRAVVIEPCAYDPAEGVWYRVVFAPETAGFGSSS
ncbi:hypothetical protein [Rhodococcus sp. W8901]|uniref:hypothetical protein n=1 Tax=Rhodococcus sp. W8901 TaxID=2742603 RepID=UPI0015834F93|nr:hypothetical protein [Rhodococcus sp. W8901]QKT11256.1 hypothetical protein HUN07_11440 [Rhodococcus sp. W8901]